MASSTATPLSPLLPQALESAPDAMIITDASGAIVFASRQACALLGYGADELDGIRIEQLMPERFRSMHIRHRAQFTAERRARPLGTALELRALRRDGSEFPVEISLSPVDHEGQALTVAAIRDVTERRRSQAELIEARETAESARRAANDAREAAERANLSKTRFLATASHDLRQPLQALALLNGTLRQLARGEEALAILTRQSEAIDAMARLLGALLELSRLESGAIKPSLEDFPAAELFLAMQAEFSAPAAAKGLTLEIMPATHILHGDRALVGQILRHLMSNALRYTPRGHVRLRAETLGDGVRIDVEDTGIGISSEELPRIYDEFYQVDDRAAAAQGGCGLGLSIVRRLVSLLDLELEVRSVVGHGSVFSLTLPGRESPPAPPPLSDPSGSQPAAQTPLVLVLEDDRAVLDAMRLLLKVHGYRVLTATTIAQALQQAREHPGLRLLITDYHLTGGETGIEAIKVLRAELGADLRVALVSGAIPSALPGLAEDARLRLVGKPIRAEQLLEMLKSLRDA